MQKWQITVNVIAEILRIPAALIMKVEPPEIMVFAASESPGNPYHHGERAALHTGLYCETVMATRRKLLVPNALKDEHWQHNPDIPLGMIAYLGFPIAWPDGAIFGTICALDTQENAYNDLSEKLLRQFRDVIETDLKYLASAHLDIQASAQSRRALLSMLEDARQTEVALREAQVRYRMLFEEAPLPLWEQDLSGLKQYLDGLRAAGVTDVGAYLQAQPAEIDACVAFIHTLDANQTAVTFYGAASKADLIANLPRIFCAASRPGLAIGLAHVADRKRFCEHEAVNVTFVGELRFLLIRWIVAPDDEATYARVIVSATDITDRKRAEDALRAAHLELMAKNVALHAANISKDKFFSIIAHDLRSPFTGLLGYLDMLNRQADALSAEMLKDYLTKLHLSAKRLYALLDNLLAWARLQRGLVEYQPTEIALATLADDIVALFAPNAEQKALTLTQTIPAAVVVSADAAMLNAIMRNLLSNAVKFTPVGGRIVISARSAAHEVEVAVADTGCGMGPDMLARLFRLDCQETTTGTAGETGTGLGLLLCHDLVRQHGGALWAESAVGRGTTFRFTLPRGVPLAPAPDDSPAAPASVVPASAVADVIVPPPLRVLRELHDLAQIGDILDIERVARDLLTQDARYAPAATRLLYLRQHLQIRQIHELIEQWLQCGQSSEL